MTQDVTPEELRQQWRDHGLYADTDIFGLFADQARSRPDQPAVIDDDGSMTYRQIVSAASRVAERLVAEGIEAGDVVGVQVPNGAISAVMDLAVAATGAVCLPYPVHFREQETLKLLGRSEAAAVVTIRSFNGHDHRHMLKQLEPELPALRIVLGVCDEDRSLSLDDALAGGDTHWTRRNLPGAAPVRVITTSGTESAPKMLLYSHEAIGRPMQAIASRLRLRAGSRLLLLVPLSSALGVCGINGVLAGHGATLVVTAAFSPERALQAIADHHVTHVLGVPTTLQMMMSHPNFDTNDLSTVEVVVTGGATAAPKTIDEIQARFGCEYATWYGSSDGSFCYTRFDDPTEQIRTTVGRPDPAVSTLRVVDADGQDQPPGEQGEVWARGPFIPLCYLGDPDLDRRYRTDDGWVKTGDLGVMDGAGYLRIVGRVKDIIIRGGYNLSPTEIEEHILTHPDVTMAACVGIPDERLGERIAAVLVVRDGATTPTVASLGEYLLGRGLAKNKLPEHVTTTDVLPLTPTGKVLKRVLRDQLAREQARE